jgi:hypothetical protein
MHCTEDENHAVGCVAMSCFFGECCFYTSFAYVAQINAGKAESRCSAV